MGNGWPPIFGMIESMQPEARLTKKVRAVFERAGGRVFKIQGGDESFQEAGIPDTLICLWGQFIGVEVKQPGAKLRPLQRVVLHEIFRAGGVAAVVETVDQAEELLRYLSRRRTHEVGLVFYRGDVLHVWPMDTIR